MSGKQPKRNPRPEVDEYGRTPLHDAALKGDVEAVRAALQAGASVDAQDDNGWTALHFAAQERQASVAEALLSAGANPNLHDVHGNGPLWTTVMNARGDNRVIQLLLDRGADARYRNNHGRSPLDMALTIKHGVETPFLEKE